MKGYLIIFISFCFFNTPLSLARESSLDKGGIVLLYALQGMRAKSTGIAFRCTSLTPDAFYSFHFDSAMNINLFTRTSMDDSCSPETTEQVVRRHTCLGPLLAQARLKAQEYREQHNSNQKYLITGQIFSTKGSKYVENILNASWTQSVAQKVASALSFSSPAHASSKCDLGVRLSVQIESGSGRNNYQPSAYAEILSPESAAQ